VGALERYGATLDVYLCKLGSLGRTKINKIRVMSEKINSYNTFLQLLEAFSTDQNEYRKILHPEMVQIEYPNLITKNGNRRNLEECLKGTEMAKKMLAQQKYDIVEYTEAGEKLIAEVIWTGKILADIGHLKKDQELKAYICMVIEFKDGKIIQQKNYDCYEPF
jgi:hypothetical protein